MNIKNNSGCLITYGDNAVEKIAPKSYPKDRIKKQANKQIQFNKFNMIGNVYSPRVLSVTDQSFSMEFVNGLDIVEFLEYSDKNSIDRIVEKIKSIVVQYDRLSENAVVNDLIRDKLKSIEKYLKPYEKNFIDMHLKEDILIPVGICHGDMTLTNMIFKDDEIVLLDFLDSFIETPLIDMVKIRQDTRFGWCRLCYTKKFDANKNMITMKYMDEIFNCFFENFSYYIKYYRLFQVLNYCRIYPYSKTKEQTFYIRNCIREIIHE